MHIYIHICIILIRLKKIGFDENKKRILKIFDGNIERISELDFNKHDNLVELNMYLCNRDKEFVELDKGSMPEISSLNQEQRKLISTIDDIDLIVFPKFKDVYKDITEEDINKLKNNKIKDINKREIFNKIIENLKNTKITEVDLLKLKILHSKKQKAEKAIEGQRKGTAEIDYLIDLAKRTRKENDNVDFISIEENKLQYKNNIKELTTLLGLDTTEIIKDLRKKRISTIERLDSLKVKKEDKKKSKKGEESSQDNLGITGEDINELKEEKNCQTILK